MRLPVFLIAASLLVGGAASAQSGKSAEDVANDGIAACNQQTLPNKVAYAACRKTAVHRAFRDRWDEPFLMALEEQDVALAEQVDSGKLTQADAEDQYNKDVAQMAQQRQAFAQRHPGGADIQNDSVFHNPPGGTPGKMK